jgi:hypothetical protein
MTTHQKSVSVRTETREIGNRMVADTSQLKRLEGAVLGENIHIKSMPSHELLHSQQDAAFIVVRAKFLNIS